MNIAIGYISFITMTEKEFKELRHQMGLTQKELAEKIGVPWNTVARWEVGMRKIAEPIARLVHYLAKEVNAKQQKKKR